jgi:hypothetical protein
MTARRFPVIVITLIILGSAVAGAQNFIPAQPRAAA